MPISVFTQTQVTSDNHHYEGYTFMGKHPFGCLKMVTYQALDLTSIFHGCDAILSASYTFGTHTYVVGTAMATVL